jgi:hypothetical protein
MARSRRDQEAAPRLNQAYRALVTVASERPTGLTIRSSLRRWAQFKLNVPVAYDWLADQGDRER